MKWRDSDFKTGIEKIRAVLIYGPDSGQIDEYCTAAIKKLGVDKDNLLTVDSDNLREKQDLIYAEACTPSMFGGQKMVIISNAGDSDAKFVSDLVSHSGLCAMVVVSGGDLRAGGGLRSLFEGAEDMAALPCYMDDAKTLTTLIRNELSASSGIQQITPDAMAYMLAHLGSDRGITRGFLRKIALYVDDKRVVELSDVEKCLPDTGAADIDDFLYSLTSGLIQQTMMALDRLLYDNKEPNMLVRMLDGHFKKLQNAVVNGQLPRLFWKVEEKFKIAIKIWPESEITAVLMRLNELERQLRTTGMPGEVLLRDFALKLAMRSAKLATKRRK